MIIITYLPVAASSKRYENHCAQFSLSDAVFNLEHGYGYICVTTSTPRYHLTKIAPFASSMEIRKMRHVVLKHTPQ